MKIEKDLVVTFDYKLTEAGQNEILDTSAGREPLEYIVGKGHIITGLEEQLM
jgi:FKBP-type peptidyl-prolyl cis-trans isomerase SlyD